MSTFNQIAAIPIRRIDGRTEVLLVTSRETQRWVIPKGWPWPQAPDHEAAAAEAWEEAGVRGQIATRPYGTFTYEKRRKSDSLPVVVAVYLLEVTEEAEAWPEVHQRTRAWFAQAAAAEAVAEAELKALLLSI